VTAVLLQQRYNLSRNALLLGHGSTGNSVRPNLDKLANASQYMLETHQDDAFQSDNILNEVELDLIWLGEESMYCLVCLSRTDAVEAQFKNSRLPASRRFIPE
jgi:hypothetical protein